MCIKSMEMAQAKTPTQLGLHSAHKIHGILGT